MSRPIRNTGINGRRLRRLRRREGWSQTDLADKLGVHRMTLSRWEAGKGDPPLDIAASMSDIFRVDPQWLFEVDPEPERERDNPDSPIRDEILRHHTLARLQRCTKPALEALNLSLEELAQQVDLPVNRLQELYHGHKPTAYEIQHLRTRLGGDFNPIYTSKKRILAQRGKIDTEGVTIDGMVLLTIKRVNELYTRVEAFEVELLQRLFRMETLQLDLLHKVDQLLKRPG